MRLFCKVTREINIPRAQDVRQRFELTERSNYGAIACVKELFALNVDLAEVTKYVFIGHLEQLFIWYCDDFGDSLQYKSTLMLMEKLCSAHAGSGTYVGTGSR
jgi:hypothetical protein